MTTQTIVAKIGSSSVTTAEGAVNESAIALFCAQVAQLKADGHRVVVVSSGAIAAGLTALDLGGDRRPRDAVTLQAVASVGQSRLMATYGHSLAEHGLTAGQVLLTPLDFGVRDQYLHARATLGRLIELGVIPVVNENDATADDEIRFGDNDRLAALVANLVRADVLVLLTDTPGLYTADPRVDVEATLIESIGANDRELQAQVGGPGTNFGSGGMASKLAAARIAAFSGVRAVIAQASRPNVLADAVAGVGGTGTFVAPRTDTLSARKLWIAFAQPSKGTVHVDAGAAAALRRRNTSLLAAGVRAVHGDFIEGDAVEVVDEDGVIARGITRVDATTARNIAGMRSGDLAETQGAIVVHRDDLVVVDT